MTKRTYIENLKEEVGNMVTIKGFAGTVRDQNKIIFVIASVGAVPIIFPRKPCLTNRGK